MAKSPSATTAQNRAATMRSRPSGAMRRMRMKFKRDVVDLPINAVNGNLIFGNGRVAAVYRIDTISFEFLSLAEKHKLHGQLAWWMIKAEADFSIYRVCREYSADAY